KQKDQEACCLMWRALRRTSPKLFLDHRVLNSNSPATSCLQNVFDSHLPPSLFLRLYRSPVALHRPHFLFSFPSPAGSCTIPIPFKIYVYQQRFNSLTSSESLVSSSTPPSIRIESPQSAGKVNQPTGTPSLHQRFMNEINAHYFTIFTPEDTEMHLNMYKQ